MKIIYIPSNCPKCENQVLIERVDRSANAFCKRCDFILPITEEELKNIGETLYIE